MFSLTSLTSLSSSLSMRRSTQPLTLADEVGTSSLITQNLGRCLLRKGSSLGLHKEHMSISLESQKSFYDAQFYKFTVSSNRSKFLVRKDEYDSMILQKSPINSTSNFSALTTDPLTGHSNARPISFQTQFTCFAGRRSPLQLADMLSSFQTTRVQYQAQETSNLSNATSSNVNPVSNSLFSKFARTPHVCQTRLVRRKLRLSPQAQASDLSGHLEGDLYSQASLSYSGFLQSLISFLSAERVKVAVMLAFALALCNADRVVMSVAIVPLSSTHRWSSSFSGIVQSSFLWGYLFSPIPGGALADRYGGKKVLGWGVAIWSAATLATPWAANHSMGLLLATRSVMGLAEGVAMPCMNNIIARWFPCSEMARAVSVSMAGFHLGSVGALLLTPLLMTKLGVSGPFVVFSLIGFFWLLLWLSTSTIPRNPQANPRVKPRERLHQRIEVPGQSTIKTGGVGLPPIGLLLLKLPTWAIIVANAMNNWGYFILLSWMPVYFNTVLGVDLRKAAWFSAIPWTMMAVIGFVAGSCSDFLIQSGVKVSSVRKIMQSIGFLGPAIALLGLNGQTNPNIASVWLTAAVGLSAFSQAGFLVNHQEIGPRYAGVLHGISNTAGTVAAIVSTVGTGYFIEKLGSFQAFLTLTSVLYILSTAFWNFYATSDEVFK
ncbi:hypothetical protein O6H91_21G040400 [Diphasiastrum complanatum]|uniref:Uncharacterized protein n=4 Tax=Diphasiastrum complanatum TaxID=34168 RepID=A0ACC2AJP5_DIPCM|nr:hypothetical protein O6H91_21G040400 [Diphasiastrum complanatum]KAJ7517781.1 hypothetical protein O6H91_21G040400 [Diphasiastrum complanatum]KAJ7517783.1 hypothetical protein O6H91_21G040400 [Diphasiastrum complanatum]KAJ7517785.1 hypothetical protein O6H91_21G040400 [Diphasiastrum complanatum]